MLSVMELTIPAQTGKGQPTSGFVVLPVGTINQVSVLFPPGVVGLVGLRCYVNEFPVVPVSADGWLVGNAETVRWSEWIRLMPTEREFVGYGYNLDDTYDHTLYIRINVEPLSAALTVREVARWLGVSSG